MQSKLSTTTPVSELWDSSQILDVLFDKHWKEFLEFAEKCLDVDITFIGDERLYEVVKRGDPNSSFQRERSRL